jgi:hypothetical protein
MAKDTQISAFVSRETKDELERFVRATGMKKGFVIEQALRNHLRALREIPAEFAIPTQVILTRKSFEKVMGEIEHPSPAPPALKRLMRGKPVSDDGLD